jgi:hypothetical protein
MILNTAGKSATAKRQATAGTSGVVDTGSKFATGVVDTVGKSPMHHNTVFATSVVFGVKNAYFFVNLAQIFFQYRCLFEYKIINNFVKFMAPKKNQH